MKVSVLDFQASVGILQILDATCTILIHVKLKHLVYQLAMIKKMVDADRDQRIGHSHVGEVCH